MITNEMIFMMWLSVGLTFMASDEFLFYRYIENHIQQFGLNGAPFGPGVGWFLYFRSLYG